MIKNAMQWFMIVNLIVWLNAAACAQDADEGKTEFESSCATCHGNDGKGKGPLSEQLKVAPADLTVLTKNNNGVFPFNAVYDVIYGIKSIAAHGTSDMPIWGNRYTFDPNRALGPKPSNRLFDFSFNPEVVVRSRVLSIIDYIDRLQEK